MKLLIKLTSLGVALFWLNLIPAHAVQLSVTADGVVIDTGSEKFLLEKPVLHKIAGGAFSSTATLSDDGKNLILKFENGATLTIFIGSDGKTVTYNCDGAVDGCQGFGVNLSIPISYATGGKYAYGPADLTNFPPEVGKVDNVAHGDYDSFKLLPPSGPGFSLKMPKSWNKLQDNRFYNNGTTFEEQYLYIFATYSGTSSFTITVDDVAAPTPSP